MQLLAHAALQARSCLASRGLQTAPGLFTPPGLCCCRSSLAAARKHPPHLDPRAPSQTEPLHPSQQRGPLPLLPPSLSSQPLTRQRRTMTQPFHSTAALMSAPTPMVSTSCPTARPRSPVGLR